MVSLTYVGIISKLILFIFQIFRIKQHCHDVPNISTPKKRENSKRRQFYTFMSRNA